MTLRKILFWPHLIAGVTASAVILIMSVTGVLLTYERQVIAWADREYRSQPFSPDANRLQVDVLLSRLRATNPEVVPTAITIASDRDAPVTLGVGQRTLYVDAYSGALLGEGSASVRRFMSDLRAWHRWLAMEGDGRQTARAITGWANLLFLFIVASGMYLWLPRRWSWMHLRTVLFFTRKTTGKARDFNWHNVIGIWSAVPLFIVVASAVPISFPWANALVYRAAGETPPSGGGREGAARQAGRGSEGERGRNGGDGARRREAGAAGERRRGDDGGRTNPFTASASVWARAEQQVPDWRTITLRAPQSPDAPLAFAIDRGDGGQPQLRSTLTLARTGELVTYETFSSLSPGRRIRNAMRFAHTGEIVGLVGQTIAGVASAGSTVLVWTGLALAWRRYRAWATRRAQAAAASYPAQGLPGETA